MAASTDAGQSVRAVEWVVPLAFIVCSAWVIWHLPAFILDWSDWSDERAKSAFDRLSAQFKRNDVTPEMAALFGGFGDFIDYACLVLIPVFGAIGVRTVQPAHLETGDWSIFDRISIFIGRVTMLLVALLLLVMLYEVVLRYVFERPTLWANELSLWIAGFLFLFAGLYAMQQRSHIRIFLLYDVLPRNLQRACDTLSTLLIAVFAFCLIWGGYGEARDQFFRWETLGTAFDPPLPATLSPAILLVVVLVTIQSFSNLIRDWNKEPVMHSAADDIDADELAAMKRMVGDRDDA